MPDLAKLYSSLHTTWDKVRVDIISHVVLFLAFLIAGVTRPSVVLPAFDVSALSNHPVYKLAKDTNALVLIPVVLLLAALAYGLVMRALGQSLSAAIVATIQPKAGDPFLASPVGVAELVTIASLLDRTDFDAQELATAASNVMVRYAARQDADLKHFQLGSQNKDAALYVGYAIVFVIGWCALFWWLPSDSAWRIQNARAFWPVLILLLLFMLRNAMLTREFLLLTPAALVAFVAYKVRADPELSSTLAAATPRLAEIEARVESLRLEAFRRAAAPSLVGYVRARLQPDAPAETTLPASARPWVRQIYDEGRLFSESEAKTKYSDPDWLESFAKYAFYRVAQSLGRLLTLILGLLLRLAGIDGWLIRVTAERRQMSLLRPRDERAVSGR